VRVVGYVRVSTVGQEQSGASLEAQKAAIVREVDGRGWELADLLGDTGSGKSTRGRPRLEWLLDRLDGGEFDGMVVSRLDRLSRSVGDFAQILDRANRKGWALVCLDPAVDLTTPYGRAMANVAAAFAQLERELISQRTSEGIRAKVAAGERVLPQPEVPDHVERRIVALRGREGGGMSLRGICRALTVEGHRPPRSGVWRPATVQKVLRRRAHDASV
jgi:DNA invertase Pin-like site-specific DNA recombinase